MSTSPELVRAFVPVPVSEARPTGFVAGFSGGYAEGLRIATTRANADALLEATGREARAAEHGSRLRACVQSLTTATTELRTRQQEQAGELADLLAEATSRLLQALVVEAAPDPAALRARLERALVLAGSGTPVLVRLAPQTVALLSDTGALDDTLPAGARLVADPTLKVGDVVVDAGPATVTDLLLDAVDRLVSELRSAEPT